MSDHDESLIETIALNLDAAIRYAQRGDSVLAGIRLGFVMRDIDGLDNSKARFRGTVLYRSVLDFASFGRF